MILEPNMYYRKVFKLGMTGWDVATIQIALGGLVEDGIFGRLTLQAVLAAQRHLGIEQDGIVGGETQRHLCRAACTQAEAHLVPAGLLWGICDGESSGIIPSTSGEYEEHTRDYGPFQDNKTVPGRTGGATQTQLKEAYTPTIEAKKTGQIIEQAYEDFHGMPGAKLAEEAWRLAVLFYNWQAAARAIAKNEGQTWKYKSRGKWYGLADPAPWIEEIGAGVSTGWEWCKHYIDTKVVYVTSWTV